MDPGPPVEQVAPASGQVRVLVTDGEGWPIPGATVTLTGVGPDGGPRTFTTDEEGLVRIGGLPAGEVTVECVWTMWRGSRRGVVVIPGRTTYVEVEVDVVPVEGEDRWWGTLLTGEPHRGTFVPGVELALLPYRSLGGVDGIARHPGVGASLLATDVVSVDGRPWSLTPPEPVVDRVDVDGAALLQAYTLLDGRLEVDAGPTGDVRAVGLVAGPLAGRVATGTGAVEGSPESVPSTFVEAALTPGNGTRVWMRGVTQGSRVDAGAGLAWNHTLAARAAGGIVGDVAGTGAPLRAWGDARVVRGGYLYEPAVRAQVLSAAEGAPLRARVGLDVAVRPADAVVLTPSLAWRHRGEEDRAEGGIHATWGLGRRHVVGLFGEVGQRWEGIDTDAVALVRRDEALVGVGVDPGNEVRVKLSVAGALRAAEGSPLPPDASVQLALHHPLTRAWGLESAATWRPLVPGGDTGLPAYEAGALATWGAERWAVWPIGGLGLGVWGGADGPRGQAAARLGVAVRTGGPAVEVAVEAGVGEPPWTTAALPGAGEAHVHAMLRVR